MYAAANVLAWPPVNRWLMGQVVEPLAWGSKK